MRVVPKFGAALFLCAFLDTDKPSVFNQRKNLSILDCFPTNSRKTYIIPLYTIMPFVVII